MSDKNLVTQGEISATLLGLQAIADNLNLHVNHSLSKAHAINAAASAYYDSGGSIQGTHILRLVVGGVVLYVPAQLNGGEYPSPVADPGPRNNNTGLVPEASADPTLDTTVGTPVQTNLVTAFAANLNAVAQFADLLLQYHAGQNHDQVHGNMQNLTEVILDTSGNKVARQIVTILYDGIVYKIPCDVSAVGPSQVPHFVTPFPVVTDQYRNGPGSPGALTDGGATLNDAAGPGDSNWLNVQMHVTFGGTYPIAYQWQYSTDNTNWLDIVEPEPTQYTGPAGTAFWARLSDPIGWAGDPISGSVNPGLGVNSQVTLILSFFSFTGPSSASPAFFIRLKIDNTASDPDGVVISSAPLRVNISDDT